MTDTSLVPQSGIYPLQNDDCAICYAPMGAPAFVKVTASAHNTLLDGVDEDGVCEDCIVRLTCGHAFHTDCMKGWVIGSAPVEDLATRVILPVNTCPFCHTPFKLDIIARVLLREWGVSDAENDKKRRIAVLVAEERRDAEERIRQAAPLPIYMAAVAGMAGVLAARDVLDVAHVHHEFGSFGLEGKSALFIWATNAAALFIALALTGKFEELRAIDAVRREQVAMGVRLLGAPERAALRIQEEDARLEAARARLNHPRPDA